MRRRTAAATDELVLGRCAVAVVLGFLVAAPVSSAAVLPVDAIATGAGGTDTATRKIKLTH